MFKVLIEIGIESKIFLRDFVKIFQRGKAVKYDLTGNSSGGTH